MLEYSAIQVTLEVSNKVDVIVHIHGNDAPTSALDTVRNGNACEPLLRVSLPILVSTYLLVILLCGIFVVVLTKTLALPNVSLILDTDNWNCRFLFTVPVKTFTIPLLIFNSPYVVSEVTLAYVLAITA